MFSTFPYWLLLTDEKINFNIKQADQMPWFSKKHSYYVHTSISEFYFNKKRKKIKLGINLTPDELIITNIFKDSLADNSNLKIDDKILKINEVLISSLQDLDKQLKTSVFIHFLL